MKGKESAPPISTSQTVVLEANINGVIVTQETEFPPNIFEINTFQNKDSISTGGYAYFDIDVFNGCKPIPDETKINVEIISGQEYGSLIDPYTYESTKSLTNLDHWFGYVYVDYEADGISIEETDTVIVRVSTTDPEITPKEVTLFIKPPPIYVYTVPDVLGADDTADVFIKHRLDDGTLEDFPPEQTFELAVLDGCVNGNFLVDTTINVYFADALQPIKFVTADIIDTTFDKVLIRVGTDLGGGGGSSRPVGNIKGEERKEVDTLRLGFERMIAEKRAKTKKKENNEPPIEAPIVTACYGFGSNKEFNWQGFASVGDECDFENSNNWKYNDVEVQLLNQLNGYEVLPDSFITICKLNDPKHPLGQSTSVSYERIRKDYSGSWKNSWILLPCKTPDEKIIFKIVGTDAPFPVPIYVDFIADVCYSIISNDGFTLINDTTELKNSNIVKNPQMMFNDICGHYCYPQVLTQNGYVLKEVTFLHEQLHMSHYQRILDGYKNSNLISALSQFTYTCKEFRKYFENIEGVATEVKSKIYTYVYESEVKYAQESGIEFKVGQVVVVPANPKQEKINERSIQSNGYLRKLIDDYHFALSRERGTPYPITTCSTCPN